MLDAANREGKANAIASVWQMTTKDKQQADMKQWTNWLETYCSRLLKEANAGAKDAVRKEAMRTTNPRVILRAARLKEAVRSAEIGHFQEVHELYGVFQFPPGKLEETSLCSASCR